ncbi:hypothetical protein E4P40_09970 [Blastococcus sp. CT_GayMR20]|uniref:hypothetical protein n=1 Tax=Blastococcus sp. CT_GayMR20 TaxID=2559609 RepID=UPI00107472E0|nr:hypothetical protein [Blastococcus sp. CT_GayMR20]TFV88384.1 hypothetical protein E4P40_09970 [Blastococcus sp. CT_GayMR20]
MLLLQETADVLERRARNSADPVQAAVLGRGAEKRRRDADSLRSRLGRPLASSDGREQAPSTRRTGNGVAEFRM